MFYIWDRDCSHLKAPPHSNLPKSVIFDTISSDNSITLARAHLFSNKILGNGVYES